MPRLENTGPEVDKWYKNEAKGNGTSTWDFCSDCAEIYGNCEVVVVPNVNPYNGDPSGLVGSEDVGHPSYDDGDYRCIVCKASLTEEEDG